VKVFYWYFMGQQTEIFKKYGYNLPRNVYDNVRDSFVMIQYPSGLAFNLSLPPNFVRLNAVTPKFAKPIKTSDENLDAFLSLHKINVYCSQGTIVKIIDFKTLFEVFNHHKDIGFVLASKKQIIGDENLKDIPKNVFVVSWVEQNDLLGDDRIHAFISHGGTNSVAESIFHFKPLIILGVTLDQINTAANVKMKNAGIVLQDTTAITSGVLIKAIADITKQDSIYKKKLPGTWEHIQK